MPAPGGARRTRRRGPYRAIPRVSGASPDVQALTEVVEVLTGARNDPLYRALTWADLQDAGLVRQLGGGFTGVIAPGDPTLPIPPGDIPGVETPNKPTGFSATGTFNAAAMFWDQPTYYGHAYTEVWRSQTDDVGTAVLIATVTGRFFSDTVDPGSTYYYWIRFVNVEGAKGPFHALGGAQAQTSILVSEIMAQMGDLLDASDLSQSLQDQIQVGVAVETFLEQNWSIESAVDNGGNVRVVGMKLLNDVGDLSKIIFNTDVFAIAPPYSPGQNEPGAPVFIIGPWTDPGTGTTTQRVVMSDAVIGDLTVGEAAIQAMRADKITVAGIPGDPSTIADVIIGQGHIDNAKIGNYIESSNWNPAQYQGWRIDRGPFPSAGMEIFGNIHIRSPIDGSTIMDAGSNTYAAAIANSQQLYNDVNGTPNSLADINNDEGLKLSTVAYFANRYNVIRSTSAPGGSSYDPDLDYWFNPATNVLHRWVGNWLEMTDFTLSHFLNDPITFGNFGTYMNTAAIDTLYVRDGLIIVPTFGDGGGKSLSTSWSYLSGTNAFIPNVGQFSQAVALEWFIEMDGHNSNAHSMDLRIRRDGTTLESYGTNDKDQWASGVRVDYPGTGTFTYELEAKGTGVQIFASALKVTAVKR